MEYLVNRKLEDFLEDYEDLREYKEMKEKLEYSPYTLDDLIELGRKVDSLHLKNEVLERPDRLEKLLVAYVDIEVLRKLIGIKEVAYDNSGIKVGESEIQLIKKEVVN